MTDVRRGVPAFQPDLLADSRLHASVERLMRDDYEVEKVMASTLADTWPGDLAGRLLLSLSRYARAGMPTAERAISLNSAMLSALEERGYLGAPLGATLDEQQVACHGWVASGLLQHSYVTGDTRSHTAAFRVLDELIIPALSRFDYPWAHQRNADAGGPSGTATEVVDGWALSTDVWCILLTLNALVPAAIDSSRNDLSNLIGGFVSIVERLDVVAHRAQLHAVMAAARNLADWAVATGDARAGAAAAALYDTYALEGRTLNYATFNWFGRPDTWTEPCAIVDSLGAATTLHELTGDARYRRDATRIARNGLEFAERQDGSFGLDTIATATMPTLSPIEPDAHWCCTMRGAIGLLEARETAARLSDGVLAISDLYPGRHHVQTQSGAWLIQQTAPRALPNSAEFTVIAAEQSSLPLEVRVAIEDVESVFLVRPDAGMHAEVNLEFMARSEHIQGADTVWIGPVLQCEVDGPGGPTRLLLSDIAGLFTATEQPLVRLSTQV